jgi:septation ring formation regulator EzrA
VCIQDCAEEDEDQNVWNFFAQGSVPARQADSKLLLTTTLPGTPKDIFDLFLSNRSHLIEDVFEQMGNRWIHLKF